MRAMLVVLLAVAGCLQAGHVVCDDGRVCPKDYTCSAVGCLSPAQLTACDGIADDEPCELPEGPGRCSDGACVVARCGNGRVEPTEVCDDGNQFGGDGCNGSCSSDESCGNGLVELAEECDCGSSEPSEEPNCAMTINGGTRCTVSCKIVRCGNGELDAGEVCDDGNSTGGDGCSFDCLSLEECGNGILDFFAGEQCDDGNTRSIDGCSPTCKVEAMAWRPYELGTPPVVLNAAAAFDTARGKLVVFGGNSSGTSQGDTWELEGTTWTRPSLVLEPVARDLSAMAYDSKRRRVVLFGGFGTAILSDTWEYDGSAWHAITPANAPSSRFGHRMAYDPARERVVLYGGQTSLSGTRVGDTWEWDGVNWVQVTPTVAAGTRSHHGMTYDPIRGRVVIFGGLPSGSTTPLGDTWEYDGTTWSDRQLTGPAARSGHTLTFDPSIGKVVMAGGTETWTLDSSGWSDVASANPDRTLHAAAFDTTRDRVILFGGLQAAVAVNTVSELAGSSWSTPTPTVPGSQSSMGVAFDSRRGRLVMLTNSQSNLETWELSGASWRLVATADEPTPRSAHAMAYDAARGKVVLFGGSFSTTRRDDTWEYDGSNWVEITPAARPPARSSHAMIYDSVRQRVVVFGGTGGAALNDAWEFDGTTWTELTATPKPPARSDHAMAYDSARRRIVLFGGVGINTADTWVLDSEGWSRLATVGAPPVVRSSRMVYDAGRDRIVMHGGIDDFQIDETWELADNTWQRLIPNLATELGPARFQHGMVYDQTANRTIMVGGSQAVGPFTWVLAAKPVAPGELCHLGQDVDGDQKVGCADDDCWGRCTPYCVPDAPTASCSMTPRCGDGTCTSVENCRSCPADCAIGAGTCPIRCGDGHCDTGENVTSCPGDCG